MIQHALVYETSRNSPKTSRIMRPVAQGLEKIGYRVEMRDSWKYPQGDETRADLLAIWGDYHGTDKIYADRPAPLLHIDNGYLKRGHHQGYYSTTFNAKQAVDYFSVASQNSPKRWLTLEETIHPWRTKGQKILVLGLSRKQCLNLGFPYPEWNKLLLAETQKHSGRTCAYREKRYDRTDISLREVLRDGSWYAVVGYATKGLLEALLEGIPIFTLGRCVAASMGVALPAPFSERLFPPNREQFFSCLAWHQWTLTEIAKGLPWQSPSPLSVAMHS